MDEKHVLVTGATGGIGKQAALEIARQGARVVISGRDQGKIDATLREIETETGNTGLDGILADLGELSGVRGLADAYTSRFDRLDVLVNNAGAIFTARGENASRIERTFALNHLAYFELARQLEDLLRKSAPSRIINVASQLHTSGEIHFDDPNLTEGYSPLKAYKQSKLANVMFTFDLAEKLDGAGVTVNAMHPGMVQSGFGKNNPGFVGRTTALVLGVVQRLRGVSAEEGADTVVYLATSPDVVDITGQYWHKRQVVEASEDAKDKIQRRKLWEISEKLLKD